MPTASTTNTNTKAKPRLNQARNTRTVKSPTDSPEEALRAKCPGTKMLFPGLKKDDDIVNVIASQAAWPEYPIIKARARKQRY
jgi:hypothetical protein